MEQYERPCITEDKLYLIDKVVRMRGKNGRFGVDHSEILNYELELANRARDDHMNHLVYKDKNPYQETDENFGPNIRTDMQLPHDLSTSQVLFKRLSKKGEISKRSSQLSILESGRQKSASARSANTNRNAPNFQQWVRAKDAEKRLKKKLIAETKREIRQELLEFAKQEKNNHDSRVNHMEQWLVNKKLNEAYKITQLRGDIQRQERIEEEARTFHENGTKNYKQWLSQRNLQEQLNQMELARLHQLQAE